MFLRIVTKPERPNPNLRLLCGDKSSWSATSVRPGGFCLQLAKLGRDSLHALSHQDTMTLSESAGRKAMLRRRMSVVDVVGKWGCENPFDSMSQDMLEKELPVSMNSSLWFTRHLSWLHFALFIQCYRKWGECFPWFGLNTICQFHPPLTNVTLIWT